ncbi:MAG: AAA family ATPase [Oligoflexales bacterium]|nr:AAA family ATPase [Oligoflexales bacterium]
MLRGKKPEVVVKRLKMFVYGPAGVGKTTAAIQFPNAYIIDTERGTDFYSNTIIKSNSVVFQSNNSSEILEELKALLTEKHPYKTLIIDPVTQLYNAIQEKWSRIFEESQKEEKKSETQDFGMRFWGKVKSEMKQIQRILVRLDMNVIMTAHQKDVYGDNFKKLGVTFDSMKGDDYLFDLIFRLEKRGKERISKTEKERSEIGENKFPAEFQWSYENFCKFYGKDILEKESAPIALANQEQVKKLEHLLRVVKVEDEVIQKWKTKADVDSWVEMTQDQIEKCITFLNNKIDSSKQEKVA